jgi:hypothetical protein
MICKIESSPGIRARDYSPGPAFADGVLLLLPGPSTRLRAVAVARS